MDVQPTTDPFAVTTHEALQALYAAPSETVMNKVTDRLEAKTRAFIAASPFCLLATSGPRGPHVTPRGDAPGFVLAPDEKTLVLPDRRGNNRLDGYRDIIDNPAVAFLFLVPGAGETLRVHGQARISTDPALRELCIAEEKLPTTVLVTTVTEVYLQCPKAFIRSSLWGERKRPEGLPSMGQLLAEHLRGGLDAAAYDRDGPARLRATLY